MGSICLQGGALPASLPPCRSWREPAGWPPKPPMLVGGLPGTASVSSVEAVPSSPAQTARGAGRGLPACFSFRVSPAAAQTFQRGHADANPAQGLGNRAAGSPWSESASFLFLSTFKRLLNPGGVWSTLRGPWPWHSRPPRPGVTMSLYRSRLDMSGLPGAPGSALLRLVPTAGLASPPARNPEASW